MMEPTYRKIPTDMAIFALTDQKYKWVRSYVASKFIYSGKAKLSDRPARRIANAIGINERSVYRHFKRLQKRNWIGKDECNGWVLFRGFDFVRQLEGWNHTRAAVMLKDDLLQFKEFLIGAVLSSIIKTGRATGTDRQSKRSMQTRFPVSLSLLQQVLGVSRSTAFTYRKDAKKAGYVKMIPNLQQITGITAKDIQLLKKNDVHKVTVQLFGSTETLEVKPQQLRKNRGFVYAQLANLITPEVLLKKR